jgi:UDP-glucose 4-epimerase
MSVEEAVEVGFLKRFDAVVHLAAFISVEESVRRPVTYWQNNMGSLMALLSNIETDHLIFASTGTAFQPASPYANTKVAGERLILDTYGTPESLFDGFTIFRFYNVSGLKPGIHPTGQPTHLIRLAALAAQRKLPFLKVYGTDYPTFDGTCVRDYIHVVDLAASLANAVEKGPSNTPYECLGTGKGSSVLEVIESMKRATGVDFPVIMAERRPGDVASMVCPSQYRHISLTKTLDDMCLSAYENL